MSNDNAFERLLEKIRAHYPSAVQIGCDLLSNLGDSPEREALFEAIEQDIVDLRREGGFVEFFDGTSIQQVAAFFCASKIEIWTVFNEVRISSADGKSPQEIVDVYHERSEKLKDVKP